jgi:ribosomal protein S18 acetylase RimI-like enzyme/predicted nucleic acid-binding protein
MVTNDETPKRAGHPQLSVPIDVLSADSPRLSEVKALWGPQRRTLGFFPDGAFADYAARGQILVAGEASALAGYLIYRISDDRALIVHLCTSENMRRSGVARTLVDRLKAITKARGLRGIGLTCRADFQANSLWPKLGFCPIHERTGRSKDNTTLTYWWFDHGQPDLFSLAAGSNAARVVAAIDANIFFDLVTDRDQGDESRALVADWLQTEIELCVANEIYQEISRGCDEAERRRCRERRSRFQLLTPPEERQTRAKAQIVDLLGEGRTVQEKSDRVHLTTAAAADVQVFLTRDEELLRRAQDIKERVGLEVVRPAELIGRIDELRRVAAYEPAKLAGSRIAWHRIKAQEIDQLPDRLIASHRGERLADFRRDLRGLLAHPDRADVFIVVDGGEVLALIAFARIDAKTIAVPRLRVASGSLSQTLARHLVFRAIQQAADTGAQWVRIEEQHLVPEFESALAEQSFFRVDNRMVRCVLRTLGTLDEVVERLTNAGGNATAETAAIAAEISRLKNDPAALAGELERVFWPAKILRAGIPAFGVAIHPKWAQHFFDERLAGQELFGADPLLALNREHVYYRAANRCGLEVPARLLWYVTKDGHFQGGMTIRACSRLVAIDVGRPKELYHRYQRLGVYQWKNVLDTANGSIVNTIMALRFVDTEVFKRPVSLDEAREFGIRANFESPVRIEEDIFRKIYELGLGDSTPTNTA